MALKTAHDFFADIKRLIPSLSEQSTEITIRIKAGAPVTVETVEFADVAKRDLTPVTRTWRLVEDDGE